MDGLLRRCPCLVFYWQGQETFIENYLTHDCVAAQPLALQLLTFFERPRRASDLVAAMPGVPADRILEAVEGLISHNLLEACDSSSKARDRAMRQWDRWGMEAQYFHWATKDVKYIYPEEVSAYDEKRKSESRSPAAFKRYPKAQKINLPPAQTDLPAKLTDVLYARRTQRHFNGKAITLDELATLLKITWGISKSRPSRTFGRIWLKTSPSGGARHPIEVYVAVHNVRGLKQGLYHYSPDRHRLHVIRLGKVKQQAEDYCAHQWWTRDAAALFFMTAMFERTMWLYDSSRSLRNIYMEAGHLCQTFCLTATALNLAPFCTSALADSMIERDLGLDGIRESVLYLAAAGHV
jgi:SagB-type dehydrogenase family enzyme